MVARNCEKMTEKLQVISEMYPKIKTKQIQFDFSENCSLADYKRILCLPLKDLDIAMLFLNAGYAQIGAFDELADSDVTK